MRVLLLLAFAALSLGQACRQSESSTADETDSAATTMATNDDASFRMLSAAAAEKMLEDGFYPAYAYPAPDGYARILLIHPGTEDDENDGAAAVAPEFVAAEFPLHDEAMHLAGPMPRAQALKKPGVTFPANTEESSVREAPALPQARTRKAVPSVLAGRPVSREEAITQAASEFGIDRIGKVAARQKFPPARRRDGGEENGLADTDSGVKVSVPHALADQAASLHLMRSPGKEPTRVATKAARKLAALVDPGENGGVEITKGFRVCGKPEESRGAIGTSGARKSGKDLSVALRDAADVLESPKSTPEQKMKSVALITNAAGEMVDYATGEHAGAAPPKAGTELARWVAGTKTAQSELKAKLGTKKEGEGGSQPLDFDQRGREPRTKPIPAAKVAVMESLTPQERAKVAANPRLRTMMSEIERLHGAPPVTVAGNRASRTSGAARSAKTGTVGDYTMGGDSGTTANTLVGLSRLAGLTTSDTKGRAASVALTVAHLSGTPYHTMAETTAPSTAFLTGQSQTGAVRLGAATQALRGLVAGATSREGRREAQNFRKSAEDVAADMPPR